MFGSTALSGAWRHNKIDQQTHLGALEPGGLTMYIHIFLFRWKPESTVADHARATSEIEAFGGTVPGLLEVVVGLNLAANNGGFNFGGYLKFESAAACQAYATHPLHIALLEWLVPLIDAVELDLDVGKLEGSS